MTSLNFSDNSRIPQQTLSKEFQISRSCFGLRQLKQAILAWVFFNLEFLGILDFLFKNSRIQTWEFQIKNSRIFSYILIRNSSLWEFQNSQLCFDQQFQNSWAFLLRTRWLGVRGYFYKEFQNLAILDFLQTRILRNSRILDFLFKNSRFICDEIPQSSWGMTQGG